MRALRRVPAEVWTAVVVVLAVIAVYLVGRANPIPPPPITTDALGPEHSESPQDYIARAADTLRPGGDPDAAHWALVSFGEGTAAPAAARAVAPVRISEVLTHVRLDGRQTPVTTVQTPATDRPAAMVSRALPQAADRIDSGYGPAAAASGPADDAVTGALREECDCVVGLVVRAPLDQLREVSHRPGVAAVEALPADAVFGSFAVRPPTTSLH